MPVLPDRSPIVNGTLYFAANDGANGRELWKSDGTAAGTVLVKDIRTGSEPTPSRISRTSSGTLYFTAETARAAASSGRATARPPEPCSPGHSPGFEHSSPQLAHERGRHALLRRERRRQRPRALEERRNDAGTVLVRDINPVVQFRPDLSPAALADMNGTLFFSSQRRHERRRALEERRNSRRHRARPRHLARDEQLFAGVAHSRERDSLLQGGSQREREGALEERRDGRRHRARPRHPTWSRRLVPGSFTHADGILFFRADDGVHGIEIWALQLDSDDDGLSDRDELALGTDLLDADSDDDGLDDGQEVHALGTNPLDVDSDDDGVSDGAEVAAGTNPLDPGRFPVALARVEVVGPGNPADGNGLGAVAYEYPISQHEVTVREFVSFLNAVADTDTYGLYDAAAPSAAYGILRVGSPGELRVLGCSGP